MSKRKTKNRRSKKNAKTKSRAPRTFSVGTFLSGLAVGLLVLATQLAFDWLDTKAQLREARADVARCNRRVETLRESLQTAQTEVESLEMGHPTLDVVGPFVHSYSKVTLKRTSGFEASTINCRDGACYALRVESIDENLDPPVMILRASQQIEGRARWIPYKLGIELVDGAYCKIRDSDTDLIISYESQDLRGVVVGVAARPKQEPFGAAQIGGNGYLVRCVPTVEIDFNGASPAPGVTTHGRVRVTIED